jgi:hypothetical protein
MKSFLLNRPRVNAPEVATSGSALAGGFGSPGATPQAKAHAGHAEATHIECVREGDRITRLLITCACGERIEIDCLYAAGA